MRTKVDLPMTDCTYRQKTKKEEMKIIKKRQKRDPPHNECRLWR